MAGRTRIKIDNKSLKDFHRQLAKLTHEQLDPMYKKIIKTLASWLLAEVIRRTPVGVKPDDLPKKAAEYWKGYTGGTLRRGWTAKTEEEAKNGSVPDIASYLKNVHISRSGGEIFLEIVNPVHYASYVEYGHRQHVGQFAPAIGKRLTKSFVEGQYMLKISEDELQRQSPKIIHKRIADFLRSVFNGK